MNVARSVIVEADPEKLTWLVNQLRMDVAATADSSDGRSNRGTAGSDKTLQDSAAGADAGDASESDDSNASDSETDDKFNRRVHKMAIGALDGVEGVVYASSKRAFLVRKPSVVVFGIRRKGVDDIESEVNTQLKRAIHFNRTGTKLAPEPIDKNK